MACLRARKSLSGCLGRSGDEGGHPDDSLRGTLCVDLLTFWSSNVAGKSARGFSWIFQLATFD